MKSSTVCTLYSGSSGNCTFISNGNTSILIDAGKSSRSLCNALRIIGSDICSIDAVFITHEHTDHIGALEVLTKKNRIPIHMTEGSAMRMKSMSQSLRSCIKVHPPIFAERIKDMTVFSFVTSHDSAMSVGYRIESDGDYAPIGYATDLGYVSDSVRKGLAGCESVVLECNHDIDMLMHGSYPYETKMRILSERGHLSNPACASFVSELVKQGTKNICLAHLSMENNTAELALSTVREAVPDCNINIVVADGSEPVMLVSRKREAHYA